MKVGIIGFARSGKTTVFNALTGAQAAVGAFGAREANVAVIKVPDERVDRLSDIYHPKKKTYAEVEFVDVAPGEGGGEDKALDSAALAALKNTDALVHVVHAFQNDAVMHPLGDNDPARDVRMLEDELQLNDLIVIEKRVERLNKENRRDKEHELLLRCQEHVEAGNPLRTLELAPQDEKALAGFQFLSRKPMLILANYGEESIGTPDPARLEAVARDNRFTLIELCGAMEMEVAQLPPDERKSFREELGLGEESRTRFLQAAYDMLGLMSFLTAGEPEVRAWTIRKGTRAVDAAGVIHSDIQRGFIRAEIIGYDDFLRAGTAVKAKELGLMRLEGKEYIMQDGDVVLFRFNV